MTRSRTHIAVLCPLALVAALALVPTASPHGGRGGLGRVSAGPLATAAADQLNITRARLVTAINAAAVARINEAAETRTSRPPRPPSSRRTSRTTSSSR